MPNSIAPSIDLATCFHALSDPLRLKIIDQLRSGEQCVCDLCDTLQTSQSKLSFHLKTLRESGLIEARQQGRWMYYRICHPQFEALQAQLINLQTPLPKRPSSCCS